MAAILLQDNVSQNREAWVEKRKGKLGGSEIAIAAGLHPRVSPFDLWLRMTEQTPEIQDNDTLWMGRELEPVVAKLFARRTGAEIRGFDATYYDDRWPDFIASPDYEYTIPDEESGLLEIKTTGLYAKNDWSDTEAPDSAHCQLIWQMGILGKYSAGRLGCLVGGSVGDFYCPRFEFDTEVFSKLRELGEQFLHLVKTVTPPAMRVEDSKKMQAWLGIKGEPKQLDASYEKQFALYTLINEDLTKKKEEVKRTEKELERVKLELLEAVGDAPAGICGDRILKRTFVAQNGYTVKPGPGYYKITIK